MTTDSLILTDRLTKTYRDFWGRARVRALDALSVAVQRGEIFGLVGPNGSGKTTTFKLLLGLLFPTSGTALVLGRPPTDISVKSRLGFLPEESYLYRFLNAEETLDFFGRLFGIPRAERKARAAKLLDRFGLTAARKRPIREYSKGMVRRVSFAQALINDPELLILDEPTSGLDPLSAREMKDLMMELRKEGKTIVLSSHLLADVQNICDRIAILDQGQLKLYGPVREILARKDHVTLTFRGLDAEAQARVVDAARQAGADLVRSDATLETLEDVFLRIVAPDRKGPGDEVRR